MARRTDAAGRGDASALNPAARVREILTGRSPGTPKALQVARVLTPRPWTRARIIIAHQQQLEHERDNAKVRLTACDGRRGTIVTPDPADRAHLVRDTAGNLLPAEEVPSARPRVYPVACCTASGVPHDSAFDWLYEAQQRLAGVPGVEYVASVTVTVRSLDAAASRARAMDIRLRDILRPRTKLAWRPMNADERRAGGDHA